MITFERAGNIGFDIGGCFPDNRISSAAKTETDTPKGNECNGLLTAAILNVSMNSPMHRLAIVLVIAISLTILVSSAAAEKRITIKAVDGHSGKPFKGITLDLWFGAKAVPPPVRVTTGADGSAVVVIPDSVESIVIAAQKVGDCRAGKEKGKSYIDENVYRIQDILQTGVAAQNLCGKAKRQESRGVLIFYIRPLHWWEWMMGS